MDDFETKKQELLAKYKKGLCTPEELDLLYYLYNFSDTDALDTPVDDEDAIQKEIWKSLPFYKEKKRKLLIRTSILAAASSIVLAIGLVYLFLPRVDNPAILSQSHSDTISPGTNAATLTLADGRRIRLDAAANGTLANETGVRIVKKADGALIYEIIEESGRDTRYNTLTTQNGETYQVRLPDGTMVWLNAASSLKYPSSFGSLDRRIVELQGEGYFEVARDKDRPFIVKSERQEVQVLGTHFNINAYRGSSGIKTTLLEGRVMVKTEHESLTIRPGQQTLLSGTQKLNVFDVDPQLAVGWKNNEFVFDEQTIEEVMDNIARWYNVSVVYSQSKPNATFGGAISRFEKVTEVLSVLEKTGAVSFEIKGRTIYVSR